mgnify:CR=1 FL=1
MPVLEHKGTNVSSANSHLYADPLGSHNGEGFCDGAQGLSILRYRLGDRSRSSML